MPRARTRGLTEINVSVTVHKGATMSLGDTGPWPEHSAATFVFGGDGAAACALRGKRRICSNRKGAPIPGVKAQPFQR
jgi:hypothetical protein